MKINTDIISDPKIDNTVNTVNAGVQSKISKLAIVLHNSDDNVKKGILQKLSNDELMEMMKQYSTAKEDINQEDEKKVRAALARIKRELSYAAGNLSGTAVGELIKSGLSLEKISLNMLNEVFAEIENKPDIHFEENILHDGLAEQEDLSGKLENSGVPVNEKNLKKMESVFTKLESVDDLNDAAVINILKSGKPLTLENIYIAKFSGTYENKTERKDMTVFERDIARIFANEKIEESDENRRNAFILYRNDIPITKDTIEKFSFLKKITENLNVSDILEIAALNIKRNKKPSDIKLENSGSQTKELNFHYSELISGLKNIQPDQLDALSESQIPINLRNIIDYPYTARRPNITAADAWRETEVSSSFDGAGRLETVSLTLSKAQLAEIQLKLTKEAAYRLAGKNIKIDTMPLEQALEEIKKAEKENFVRNLGIVGALKSEENITKMSTVFDKVSQFRFMSGNVIADIIQRKADFTIKGVSESAKRNRILDTLDKLRTDPSVKYGDNFAKIKDDIKPFLQRIGIPPSTDSVYSASILVRNNMEVTTENIARMNTINSKINSIYNKLHPNIAASMIKEGMDISGAHIDIVLDYIDRFNGAYGNDLGEKMNERIMDMDKTGKLSPEEREGIVSVYKMLNIFRKNGSAAIGATIKHGLNPTLGNLLEASRLYEESKSGLGFSARVDDSMTIHYKTSNIRNALEAAAENAAALNSGNIDRINDLLSMANMGVTEANIHNAAEALRHDNNEKVLLMLENNMESIKNTAESAEPWEISQVLKENKDAPLDELKDFVMQANADRKITEDKLQNIISSFQNTETETVYWLMKNNIRMSYENIAALNLLIEDQFAFSKLLKDVSEEMDIPVENSDLEHIKETGGEAGVMKNIEDHIGKLENKSILGSKSRSIETLKNIMNIVPKSKNNYSIPIKLNGTIKGLNLFILNKEMEKSEVNSALISINTEKLGEIQANVRLDKHFGKLIANIVTNSRKGYEILSENKDILKKNIGLLGITEADISIELGSISNIYRHQIVERKSLNDLVDSCISLR